MSEKIDETRDKTIDEMRDEMRDETVSWMIDVIIDVITEERERFAEYSIAWVALRDIRNVARSFGVSEEVAAEKLGYSLEGYEKMKKNVQEMYDGKENKR